MEAQSNHHVGLMLMIAFFTVLVVIFVAYTHVEELPPPTQDMHVSAD